MSTQVPGLFRGLIDDAAIFPPGNASVPDAVSGHREHRRSWYAGLIGPLLVPAIDLATVEVDALLEVGVIGERAVLAKALDAVPASVRVRHVESPVAKRGEDPMPGLKGFLAMLGGGLTGYAEIPLTWGLIAALDHVAEARAGGAAVAPKFRTGGLAAELFPTPVELAAVICACRDRGLPFKLTAGLHHAIRHTDPETGLVHHGFLNVLAAALTAADGGEPMDLAEVLGTVDAVPLLNTARPALYHDRPLWIGFGSCSIGEPIDDLVALGLLRMAENAPENT